MSGGEPPVKRLARRVAFENRVWRVFADHVVDAAGAEVRDYIVFNQKAHPPGAVGGVAVLPVLGDGRVVLVRHWRPALDSWGWEAVKGFVDAGEDPAIAAAREMAEETGLACAPQNLVRLGNVAPDPAVLAGLVALYIARDCAPAPGLAPPGDELGIGARRPFARDDAAALAASGEMIDAVSLLLLARLAGSA